MNNQCKICGEGTLSLRCEFTDFLLNWEEHYLCNAEAVTTEVPMYYHACDVCGVEQADWVCLDVNRIPAKQARWEYYNESTD